MIKSITRSFIFVWLRKTQENFNKNNTIDILCEWKIWYILKWFNFGKNSIEGQCLDSPYFLYTRVQPWLGRGYNRKPNGGHNIGINFFQPFQSRKKIFIAVTILCSKNIKYCVNYSLTRADLDLKIDVWREF